MSKLDRRNFLKSLAVAPVGAKALTELTPEAAKEVEGRNKLIDSGIVLLPDGVPACTVMSIQDRKYLGASLRKYGKYR
jgi:hypothetical protein